MKRWQRLGKLADFETFPDAAGVYLFIYKALKSRVYYVGTAIGEGGLRSRNGKEYHSKDRGFLYGKGFLFKCTPNEDVYDKMCFRNKGEAWSSYRSRLLRMEPGRLTDHFIIARLDWDGSSLGLENIWDRSSVDS
jgi:hypothetical protein